MPKGFDLVPLKIPDWMSKYNPNEGSFVSDTFRQALATPIPHKNGYAPKPRPSGFPSCSVLLYMEKYRGETKGFFEGQQEFNMEYYCDVGNVLHEKAQYFMGLSGVEFGDWKCLNRKCKKGIAAMNTTTADGQIVKEGKITTKDTTKNLCPKCDKAMLYVEKLVEYKGLRGFVDGIWKLPKKMGGGYWIVDYKTTSMKKLEKEDAYPETKHVHQLPFYCYVLEKKYGMKIQGFSLIYTARDNPNCFHEYAQDWSDKWRKKAKKVAVQEAKTLKALNDDIENDTFDNVIACKPCGSETEYRRKMHCFDDCPMLDVCFSEGRLVKRLKQWKKVHDAGKAPKNVKIAEAIKLVARKANGAKNNLGLTKPARGVKKPKHTSL